MNQVQTKKTNFSNSFKELLTTAKKILIIIDNEASLDSLAAASALFLTLKNNNKKVTFAAPQKQASPHKDLVGCEDIKTEISNKNLVISFDYKKSAVEKVNYHIGQKTQRFYLTVEPQKNQQPLDKETVEIEYVGAEADLVFLFGVHDYEVLGDLYLINEQLFSDAKVVTIHNFAPDIGDIHLTAEEELNLSAVVVNLLQQLNLEIPVDAATNLLLSLEAETKNLSSLATTSKVLEQAAWLMRQGGRRVSIVKKSKVEVEQQGQVKVDGLN